MVRGCQFELTLILLTSALTSSLKSTHAGGRVADGPPARALVSLPKILLLLLLSAASSSLVDAASLWRLVVKPSYLAPDRGT